MDLRHLNNEFPAVWDILSRKGCKVGMFGSLHTYPLPDNVADYSFYVPDTFAAGPECFPAKYNAFQNFNLTMAGLNGLQVNRSIAFKEAVQFLAAAPKLGLRGKTVGKIALQLVGERVTPDRSVRRRTSQVQIAFDFYLRAMKKHKPDISFFFTNHVASSMHRYWPSLFPDDYQKLEFDQLWIDTWSEEIPHTMRETALQLASLINFVDNNSDHLLVVATSMGQAAVDGSERIERVVTINSLTQLMHGIGFRPEHWRKLPAMVPQFNLSVVDDHRSMFLRRIKGLKVNGCRVEVTELGSGVIKLELCLPNQYLNSIQFNEMDVAPASFGICCQEMMDAAGANAYHIPEGMLMIYDPKNLNAGGRELSIISTLEITPTLLKNFEVEIPSYMENALSL